MSAAPAGSEHVGHPNSINNTRQPTTTMIHTNSSSSLVSGPQSMGAGVNAGGAPPHTGADPVPPHFPLGPSGVAHSRSGNAPPQLFAKSIPPAGPDSGGSKNRQPMQPNGPFLIGKKVIVPGKLPFPPPMMNVKGGKMILQSPAFPAPLAPNKGVLAQKNVMWPPAPGGRLVKRPPGHLQQQPFQQLPLSSGAVGQTSAENRPMSAIPTPRTGDAHTFSLAPAPAAAVTAPSGQGSSLTIGLGTQNVDPNKGKTQAPLPAKNLGTVPFPLASRPLPRDGSNRVAHSTSLSGTPFEGSSQPPHFMPLSSMQGKVHSGITVADEFVTPLSEKKAMFQGKGSAQTIAHPGQPGGIHPGSSYIPIQSPGMLGLSASLNPESRPSATTGAPKDSMEMHSRTQIPPKELQQQAAGQDGTDPAVGSKPTDLVLVPDKTAHGESSLEANQAGGEVPPKPPRQSLKKKFSRFARLLVDSDEDSDECASNQDDDTHADGDGVEAKGEGTRSGEEASVNHTSEETPAVVADDPPQAGDTIDAAEATAAEAEAQTPWDSHGDTQLKESLVSVESSETPVLEAQYVEDQRKNSFPELPPRSNSSTSLPTSGLKSESHTKESAHPRSGSVHAPAGLAKAGKKVSAEVPKVLSASKRKSIASVVSTRLNKDVALPCRKDSQGSNIQAKVTASRSQLPLSNIDSSEDKAGPTKRNIAAASVDRLVEHPHDQTPTTESRELSERFDDLASNEFVSSTTMSNDEGVKKKAPRHRPPPPLSKFKSSELYHLYRILKELDDRKVAGRASCDRIQRKSKTPLSSHHTSPMSRGHTPNHKRHHSNYAESDKGDNDDWVRRGHSPHFCSSQQESRWQRHGAPQGAGSDRIPWRCGAKTIISSGFGPPSPLRRPLGFINVGGGFYERVGYSPYAQRRLRSSISPEEALISPGVDAHVTTRGTLKDGDMWQIMREQGQAAVRAAQSDLLYQTTGTRRVDAGAGSSPTVGFLNSPPRGRCSKDLDRFTPPDAGLNRFSHVGGSTSRGNGDSSHRYCTSARPTRRLISPSPSAEDVSAPLVSDPLASAEHISNGYVAPNLIKDAAKALDMFLNKAPRQQLRSPNADSSSNKRITSDSVNNRDSGEGAYLHSKKYAEHTSAFPEGFIKYSLHSYEDDDPLSQKKTSSVRSRRSKYGDSHTQIQPVRQVRNVKEEGVLFEKISTNNRAQHSHNYASDRRTKETEAMDYETSPCFSRPHRATVRSSAKDNAYHQRNSKAFPREYGETHYDSGDDIAEGTRRIDDAARQAFLLRKRPASSLPLPGRSQREYLDEAVPMSGKHSATEAVDSFMHPSEVVKKSVRPAGGSTTLPKRSLNGRGHDNAKAPPEGSTFSNTALSAVERRAKSTPAPKKRAAFASAAQTTSMATANVLHDPFSRVASRATHRRDKFGQNKVNLCSEWVDEVLSSALRPKGPIGAEVSRNDSKLSGRSSVGAAPYVEIPLVDMRKEFKPTTSQDLARRPPSRGGGRSARGGPSPPVDGAVDRALRPHIPTIHFHPPPPSSASRGSTEGNWRPRSASTGRRVVAVDVPRGMPYEAYSTMRVKCPTRPSPWARAPSPQRGGGDWLGRPAARRVLPTPPASDTDDGGVRAEGGAAAAASHGKAAQRLIQELHLDEHRRPYVILKEVPTGEAAKEQRLSVERLSRPKPVFVRPEGVRK